MRNCSWTEEQLRQIKAEGPNHTSKEWAKILNKKEETVKSMFRKLSLDWKRSRRTENKDDEIRTLLKTENPHKIAEILGIPKGSVYSAVKRMGLEINITGRTPELYRKIQTASAKIQRINSREKATSKFGEWNAVSAYIFGVLWADGYITDTGIALGVSARDKEWHAKLGNWLQPGITIKERPIKRNGKVYWAVFWTWCCVEGARLLGEMGLQRRKSFTNPPYPYIPDEFFHHFARGVQDGDGSPTETALRWYGSPSFMQGFREQALSVWPDVTPNELMDHKKLKVLQWGAEEDLQKIVPRLYQDCGEWFLPRKRKGQEFISLRDLKTIWDAAKNRGPTDREVEWVRKFYRSYGFPYPVVARSKIPEEVEKVRNTSVQDIFRQGKIIHNKRGLSLVNMLHQGLWSARTRSGKTYLEIFQDDTTLEKIIRDRFKHGNGLTPAQLLVGIRMRAKGPANYPPATAKAIYDKFLPNGGIVLDPCGGYGGRMLAALCSSQVNYHVSLEPATNTYRDTRMMLSILQKTVPQLNIRKAKLLNTTAEDYCPAEKEGFFDLVFTSPPYFNQEIYSDEPDQVSSTCKTLADYKVWIEKVSRNWIRMMKPGALLLLQVSDPVVLGLQRMPIVKQWTSVLNETPLVKHPELIYDSPGGRGARVTETLLHYQKPFTTKT